MCAILGFVACVDRAQCAFSCFSTIFTAIYASMLVARRNAAFSRTQSMLKRVRDGLERLITSRWSKRDRIAVKMTASGRHGRDGIGRRYCT